MKRASLALNQLGGKLSEEIRKYAISSWFIGNIEAAIDFPESLDDITHQEVIEKVKPFLKYLKN